jgi:hypothetical protein
VISLTGTGVADTSGLGLVPTSTALSYGPQLQNTTSGDQIVYFYNTGNTSITFGTATITGDFAIPSNGCTGSLAGSLNGAYGTGDSLPYCAIYVSFTPTASGTRSGTLTLPYTQQGTASQQVINLTGIGVAGTQTLLFIPATTGFGSVVTGTTSASQQVIVYNSGSETVTFSATPTTASPFAITSNGCGGNGNLLNPSASCTILITMAPTTTGAQSGTLAFSSNATNTPQSVSLTGNGVSSAPPVTFSPATLPFAPQSVNTTSASQNIQVTYNSSATITSVVASSGFTLTSASPASCLTSVSASTTCTYSVAFAPTTAGNVTGTLTITDNQTGSPFIANLDGFGSAPTLTVTPSALDFPTVIQGSTYSYLLVTVTNPAINGTTVTGIGAAISGTNAGDFPFYSNGCGTGSGSLSPGGSCVLYVNFTPSGIGARAATLTITSNTGGSPQTVSLSGTGVADTTPTLVVSPSSLGFPTVVQGSTYSYLSVNVYNPGNTTVTGIGAAISGTNAGDFPFYSNGCGTGSGSVGPNISCIVYINFTPSGTGTRTATLTITSNTGGSPQTVPLSGTGVADTTPMLVVTPTTMVFPTVVQGSTYGYSTAVTVTNPGNTTVTGIGAAISGTNSGDFPFYSNGCGTGTGSLGPSASCYVYVSFAPTGTGARSATLTITSNTSGSPQTIPLSGTGVASSTPTLVVTPTTMVFPTVVQGSTYGYSTAVTVTNPGNTTVTGIGAAISGTNAGDFPFYSNGCGTGSFSMGAGSSCYVYVSFAPTGAGARSATLTITSNSSGSPQTVPLSGTGVASTSTLIANPTILPFPDTPVGTSFSGTYLTAVVTNTGNAPVTGVGATIGGANAGDYSFYSNGCGTGTLTVNPSGTCTLYLMFTPTASGARPASVTVTSTNGGSVTINLTGNGVAAQNTAAVSPATLNVGTETIGTTLTDAASVALWATGNVPIKVNSVNITANYSIQSNSCSTVQPGNSCTIYINFTPSTSGTLTGTLTISDSSTSGTHTVNLSGVGITTAQAIELSQTSVNFGNQPIGTPSTAAIVYYSNQGPSTVQITALSVTTLSSDYSLTGSSCVSGSNIGSTSYCVISITFNPTATGTRSGAITITDTATGSPRTITLSGTGVTPFPIVSLSPTNLVFPSQNIGTSSSAQAITLTNTGTAALTFSTPTFAGDFSLSSNGCTSPLAAKGSCIFYVIFTPTATGTRTGTFTLTSNASSSPNQIPLSGTGAGTGPAVTLSPDALTFASQTVGTSSTAQIVTLTNAGNGPLTITSITASPNFSETNTCPISPSTLAASLSCQISVTFAPTTTGNLQGSVTIVDNAAGGQQVVNLGGMGTPAAPGVNLSPTTLVFSNQPISVPSAAQDVTLKNTGAGTLTIGSIAASGDFQETNNCGSNLASGSTCTVAVTFTPTAAGTRTGTLIFTDNGPGSPQSIALSGTGIDAPLVTLSPLNLTFGSVNVSSSSAPQSVTLTNTGTAALSITSISLTSGSPNFSESNTCPASLAIGANCTIAVTFTPTTPGALGGTVTISDNTYNTPQSISLSGTGVGPEAVLSTGSLTFATQNLGTTSAAQIVTLYNEGTSTLTGIGISLTGDFAQTNTCSTTLAAGSNCSISVTFTPTATGTRTGTLSVADSAPGSPQTVSLTGTGTGAVITLNPTSLTFASQTVGTTSSAQNITVTNTGNSTLSFSNIQSTLSDFGFTNNCPTNIAPNTPCTISVTFTPTATGTRSGNLILTDNTTTSPQTITLTGTAVGAPAATLNPTSLTFSSQTVGTTSTAQSITLTNSGTATLNISTVTISGDFADTNNCAGIALGIGGNCTINVSFTPTTTGTRTGTVVITDNASNSPQSVSLTGTGTGTPGISFSPTTLTFASQSVGTTSTAQTVTITNNGTAPLTITAIGTTGDFAQTSTCPLSPSSLSTGANCTVSVTFKPTTTGTRLGTLTVTDNAPGSPQSVSLTGTGTSANSSTTVTTSANPSTVNQSVTFTATVVAVAPATGTPTGTVSFTSNGSAISGCTSVALSGGSGTCTTSALPAGTDSIVATYGGDTTFNGSNGSVTQTVNKAATSTSVVSSANPSSANQTVTFTASVTSTSGSAPIAPSGTVAFTSNGGAISGCSSVALSGGTATCTTTTLAVGTDSIAAAYSGDSNFNSSSGSLTETVNKGSSTTSLTSSANPSTTGQSVTFTATVAAVAPATGTPTGSVSFTSNGSAITGCTTVALSGSTATCTTTTLAVGSDSITAAYSGDSNFNSSSGSLTETVNNKLSSTTTVSSSANPSVLNQSVTFSATVTGTGGTPTGAVSFTDNGAAIGGCTSVALNGTGVATCTDAALTGGSHTILASYGGDANYNASSGSLAQTVNKDNSTTSLTSSANPSTTGQSVTFTATVAAVAPATGTPTGTVSFTSNGGAISGCSSVALSGGTATCTTTTLAVGTDSIAAAYSGDSNFNSSSGSLTETVNKGSSTTSLTSSANPSTTGQSVTFTATVAAVAPATGTPTGSVSFTSNGSAITGCTTVALSGSTATCTTTTLAVGSDSITAAYSGDSNFNSSSGSLTETVNNKLSSTTTVSSSANPSVLNQSVTFSATVTGTGGTPTGAVSFTDNGAAIGGCTSVALNGTGVATCTDAALTGGSHTILASYGGDANYNASSGSLAQTVNKDNSTTSLTSSANPSTTGQSVTFTATVAAVAPATGTPTGTVSFTSNGGAISGCSSVALSGGTATCTTTTLAVGTDSIAAAYSGDSNFNSSSGSLTETVNKGSSTTSLTSSANPSTTGQSVTFTATVAAVAPATGTPTGSVSFTSNGSAITGCTTVALSGSTATCTTTTLAVGSDSIAAAYSGDSNFNSSSSGSLTQTVNNSSGTTPGITINPTSLTFPNQVVTTTSAQMVINVSSSGTAPLLISSIAVTGTNPVDFVETTNCPTGTVALAPGNSCGIFISFAPTDLGARSASVVVTDNNGNVSGSQQSVPLSGTGVDVPTVPSTTYNITGNPFTTFTGSAACPPDCNITGSFTLSQPLAPNLSLATISPSSFSFSVGPNVLNQSNAAATFSNVSTDASGNITGWDITLANTNLSIITSNVNEVASDSFQISSPQGTASNSGSPATWPTTTVTPLTFQASTTPVSNVATLNCPSGTVPCTDPNAHSFKLTIPAVSTGFTLTVTSFEVPPSQATGDCLAGQTEATNFPCRFVTYFNLGSDGHGGTLVPQCIPYADGNCVFYRVSNTPPDGSYTQGISEFIAWNNTSFTPSSFYDCSNPQLYDDPDSPPYDINHQFVFDITQYFVSGGGHVGVDPGVSGSTKKFNDFVVACPQAPTSPYTATVLSPLGSPTVTSGATVPVAFTLQQSGSYTGNALVAPNVVAIGVVNSSGVRQPTLDPTTGVAAVFVYNSSANPPQYQLNLSTQGYAAGTYQLFINSNLFPQLTESFTVTQAAPLVTVSSSVNPSNLGQSVTFTATVAAVAPATGTPTGTVSFTSNGSAISGCSSVVLSGGTATCTTTTLAVGADSITVTYSGDSYFGGSSASLRQQVNSTAALSITTASLPSGQVGVAYSASITATGGTTPYKFTMTGLPAGLTQSSSGSNQITGTPTASGTFTVTVTVTDSSNPVQTASKTYSLTIAAASTGEPAISIKYLDQGTNSGNYFVDLTVTNTGTGNAAAVSISKLAFRVLSGTGTVTYNTTLSPALPLALGRLNAGSSTTVRLYLNVNGTVTIFSISENGNVVDMSGTTLAYASGQVVID